MNLRLSSLAALWFTSQCDQKVSQHFILEEVKTRRYMYVSVARGCSVSARGGMK